MRLATIGLTSAVLAISMSTLVSASPGSTQKGPPGERYPWHARVASARRFARHRTGSSSFAVIGEHGNLRGWRIERRFHSASVVKLMLLVSYLRRESVRLRRLHSSEKALLRPMIERSDNSSATAIYNVVGNSGLRHLARVAGMKRFQPSFIWGLSEITAADQAPFLYRLRRYIPKRHRRYAFHLLSHIVSYQRWGVAPAKPRGWRVYFKGGFVPATGGWRINQVARLTRGDHKLAVAVLTQGNPTERYGEKTIQGVTARLLRRYNRLTVPGVN
jgi:hypothetical protein